MQQPERKYKHLTFDDRLAIQIGLDKSMTFKTIAKDIGKDQTTVSKEVKKHITITPSTVKHFDSERKPVPPPICPQLLKAPFVCNACPKRRTRCACDKQLYLAKQAHQEYETTLSESREGIALNHEQFYTNDQIIYNGLNQGQHIYHIMGTHDLGVSKSSVYRYLHKGYLSASPLDFPRVVKFKPRCKPQAQYVPKAAKVGRTYEDFLNFIELHDITNWVEMDLLIGRPGGKTILTFDFTFCNFMPAFLLQDKAAATVASRFINLKQQFSVKEIAFGDVFPLILTDNGGEFSDVLSIENGLDGRKETALFFCDPMQSHQKPKVEKNHTLFRDIVPKGNSFDAFTQEHISIIFSHVNSVKRKIFKGKSPFELFDFTFGGDIAEIMGIVPIRAEDVIQSPKLLKNLGF